MKSITYDEYRAKETAISARLLLHIVAGMGLLLIGQDFLTRALRTGDGLYIIATVFAAGYLIMHVVYVYRCIADIQKLDNVIKRKLNDK